MRIYVAQRGITGRALCPMPLDPKDEPFRFTQQECVTDGVEVTLLVSSQREYSYFEIAAMLAAHKETPRGQDA